MFDPFNDNTSLGMELKEAWKEIEKLKKENDELKDKIEGKDGLIKYLEKQIEQYQNNEEKLEEENKFLKKELSRYLDGE